MLFHRERPLSPFAVDHRRARGRLIPEGASPTRTEFQRDRDRVLHSNAFRRLKHKTQVFVEHEGDHYRTRLTHTLEVAQIARSISRILGLDEDLAEVLALAHDLGHTPFGHAGEDVLDGLMAPFGGFDHNAQALRIVTRLEHRYAAFDGLNLTWETLEGIVKHNGPLLDAAGNPAGSYAERGVPIAILEFNAIFPLDLHHFASAEAQVAGLADDIAYNAHDIDDGLRAGLFPLEALKVVPFLADILAEIEALWPGLDADRTAHEIMRRVITRLVEDLASESERRLVACSPRSAEEVRAAEAPVIAFSPAMAQAVRDLRAFLFSAMYRHPRILTLRAAAETILTDLFRLYVARPTEMGGADPRDNEEARRNRRAADYIAGMTDRFAIQEHQRLFDVTPRLR